MPPTRTTSFLWGSHVEASFCTASEVAAAWCNTAADVLSMQTKQMISLTILTADAVWCHCMQVRPLLGFWVFLLLTKDGKNENFYSHLYKSNDIPFK